MFDPKLLVKILFLDIDGVLNSAQSSHMHHRERKKAERGEPSWLDCLGRRALREDEFCPIACSNLADILDIIPDLNIVVSSTWRMGRTVEELRDVLTKAGIPRERVLDKTIILHHEQRGVEIKEWLSRNKTEVYCVLDDDSDMNDVRDNFIQTDWLVGLDFHTRNKVINHFKQTVE